MDVGAFDVKSCFDARHLAPERDRRPSILAHGHRHKGDWMGGRDLRESRLELRPKMRCQILGCGIDIGERRHFIEQTVIERGSDLRQHLLKRGEVDRHSNLIHISSFNFAFNLEVVAVGALARTWISVEDMRR